jgi:uncharacterized protein DUF4190
MTHPTPPGSGDQGNPTPEPPYQPPIEAYTPPPDPIYQQPQDPAGQGYRPPEHGYQQPRPPYPAPPSPAYQPADPGYPPAPIQPYQPQDQAYLAPAYQYGGYPDPYGYPTHRPTDGLAIASMVVSCVAVPALCLDGFGGLIGIVGAILGHVAQRRIRTTGAGGAGMALAGVIVGWIATALGLLIGIGLILLVVHTAHTATATTRI